MNYELINKLTGTGVALITPFAKKSEVDFDALEKMIDFVIDGGVEYIVTLGTKRLHLAKKNNQIL